MSKDSQDIKLTLLENGLDFICSAVEHLGLDSSNRSLKYAVLHFAAGVELILKERLRRQSWKLVFADPDRADDCAYRRGAFRSVSLEAALDRLESKCDVEFDQSERRRLTGIRDKRNRIQHFNLVDSSSAIIATAHMDDEVGVGPLPKCEMPILINVETSLVRSLVNQSEGIVDSPLDRYEPRIRIVR